MLMCFVPSASVYLFVPLALGLLCHIVDCLSYAFHQPVPVTRVSSTIVSSTLSCASEKLLIISTTEPVILLNSCLCLAAKFLTIS